MFSARDTLQQVDPELWQVIQAEDRRQEDHIELIASENYVSYAVMQASAITVVASTLTWLSRLRLIV